MKKLVLLALCFSFAFASYGQVINEFHYDNTGGDVGEFVEVFVAGPTFPANIADYEVYRYNGSGGAFYGFDDLGTSFSTDACNNRYYVIEYAPNGLQNGGSNPDGIALVDDSGTLLQFISYEGSFTASNGPAMGATSADVGVSETSGTPVGASIEWTGSGWVNQSTDTRGAENANIDPGLACVPGAAVPTLGEWGLIVLFLMLMSMGTVFFMRRQTILAGTGGMSVSDKIPFNGAAYGKVLLVTFGLVVLGFAVAILAFGYSLTNADIPGILIATPILAYLLHLLGFGAAKK